MQPTSLDTSVVTELCDAQSDAEWDEFVSTSSQGTFYHLAGWKPAITRGLGHQTYYIAARRDARIVGVLPLVLVSSRLFGRILCSMPFVNFGGPCSDDEAVAEALIGKAVQTTKDLECDYLEIRARSFLGERLPSAQNKVTLHLKLARDPEQLWASFTSKHRNNIRRIQKRGLSVAAGGRELLPAFYSVMERTWRSLGTPLYDRSFFEAVTDSLGRGIRVFTCSLDQEVVAVALNGEFRDTVEGMWAATAPEHRDLQPNYVLYWEMIRDACARGFEHYNLGRSTVDSGADQFKRRWNAEASQLYWHYHLHRAARPPALNVDNPRYQMAMAVWRRLPLWATGAIGRRVAPLIP